MPDDAANPAAGPSGSVAGFVGMSWFGEDQPAALIALISCALVMSARPSIPMSCAIW